MNTITITKDNAQRAYKQGDDSVKKVLAELLGKEAVTPQKITDRVKTFEDACTELGIDADQYLEIEAFDGLLNDTASIKAHAKLIIIARALNEGWKPDWKNSNEYKYWPWFNFSGSALAFFGCGCRCSASTVGSRLCFKSRELAEYAGRQFLNIYSDFFTI